jgi:hypothetical protein
VPFALTFDLAHCAVDLPVAGESVPALPLPFVEPPTDDGAEDGDGDRGVDWRVARDVLRRRTSCSDDHGSEYDVDGGSVAERYTGRVEVDSRTWEQRAESSAEFTLRWPGATVRARADVTLVADATTFDLRVELGTWHDDEPFASRTWERRIPRALG